MGPRRALPAVLLLGAVAERVSVDLSFGVRFRVGPPAGTSCNSTSYPIGLNDKQVNGLTQANGVRDAAGCLEAACAMGADLYQVSVPAVATHRELRVRVVRTRLA